MAKPGRPKKWAEKQKISIVGPPQIFARAQQLADDNSISRSDLIIILLEQALEHIDEFKLGEEQTQADGENPTPTEP